MRPGVVEVEFLTETHRIVGKLEVGIRRLSDVLNVRSEVSLGLQEVRISSFANNELPAMVDLVHLFKEGILLSLPHGGEAERPLEYRQKVRHRVQLNIPPFSVIGDLHLIREVSLRKALAETIPTFLPLSGVHIVYMPQPSLNWMRPAAIVNRRRASFVRPIAS